MSRICRLNSKYPTGMRMASIMYSLVFTLYLLLEGLHAGYCSV